MRSFVDYLEEKERWITFVDSEFYPDYLEKAILEYSPVEAEFNKLLTEAKSSEELYLLISQKPQRIRIQLLRIFRKYVSPDTSVEMLKSKGKSEKIIESFGNRFRPLSQVIKKFNSRPKPDEPLAAILHEYKERGQKGYSLTKEFFVWFAKKFEKDFYIVGPTGAGKDIDLKEIFEKYPRSRPVDFIIYEKTSKKPVVIGLARYDSDRGGSQEDDRTGGYGNVIREIASYFANQKVRVKILFLNDGPGLTLGSMWRDYASLETIGNGYVMVVTLKMLNARLTKEWLLER